MTDYLKALAAAREAHTYVKHLGMTRAEAALGDLLAALDAQVPVAWRIFDGEGGYDFRDELPSENSRAWSARYGRKWEPLFAAPPAALAVPADQEPITAGPGNYYGSLEVRCKDGTPEWCVENYSGHHWEPCPPVVYAALLAAALAGKEVGRDK